MDIAHELLNKPNYFTCERFHCRLRIEICVGRQIANRQPRKPLNPIAFEGCEGCAQGEKIMQQLKAMNENTQICETEACENKTITPKHRFCASCLARKSNEARKATNAKVKALAKSNSKGKGKAEKLSHVPISSFEIHFDHYKTLFDQIQDLATEQIRTPEQQILYLLKTHPNLVKVS